ncbi:L,D-transpeptidase [Nocardioides daeguensis]|uniref:L,D-TPase catalytic domain-containing protein n=1 Tax=Nocardioides daeguensis TaxID=908359 RepID=A0ABP6VV73_9ACTN|nr:L,D-transpeptidase [Nocardioides daeguensis]MBV6728424.1 L,D-transpeptidase [Nocardioides daeguensis]MCR1773848.1 L,D-transpeptidase [Nocardioides daeguensis]
MSKHAARSSTGRHRAQAGPKPRYGRITALAAALTVTAVATAGGFGLLPGEPEEPAAASPTTPAAASTTARPAPEPASEQEERAVAAPPVSGALADASTQIAALSDSTALPARSGSGRRIVFSESRQRVWLVEDDGAVERTYLVSGSVEDNLDPGTYTVYSRSRNAIGVDDSGTMEYFVRFTQGTAGAAIGFHTIPVDDGKPVQTRAQLGTPLSHGCIRQDRPHAIALWDFAPVGTKVVVTA